MIPFDIKKNKNPVNPLFTGFLVLRWSLSAEEEGSTVLVLGLPYYFPGHN
jgi:hypothetical protein